MGAYIVSGLPSLCGPENKRDLPPFYVRWLDPITKAPIERATFLGSRVLYPVFRWKQIGETWVWDDTSFVPMTYPEPPPDYTPEELAKMEAAEKKRQRKNKS